MWSQSHGGKLFHLKFTFNLFRHYNINLTWFEASLRFEKKEFMAKSKTDVMLTIHKHTAGHVKDNRKCYNEEGDDMRPEATFTSQSPQIKFPEFPVAFNIQLSQPLKCVHNQVTSQHWASHLGKYPRCAFDWGKGYQRGNGKVHLFLHHEHDQPMSSFS